MSKYTDEEVKLFAELIRLQKEYERAQAQVRRVSSDYKEFWDNNAYVAWDSENIEETHYILHQGQMWEIRFDADSPYPIVCKLTGPSSIFVDLDAIEGIKYG